MINLFEGFKKFVEDKEADKFVHTMKHQLDPLTLTAFKTQPIVVPVGHKFGKKRNQRPLSLLVKNHDDNTVTLCPVPQHGTTFDEPVFDQDGEFDKSTGYPEETEEYVISHDEFKKLIMALPKPPQQPGATL